MAVKRKEHGHISSAEWDRMLDAADEGMSIEEGDYVRKVEGYPWPGKVVAVFNTIAGRRRCVVECTAPAVKGALHIYSPLQLRKVNVHKAVRVSHTGEKNDNSGRRAVGTEEPDS